MLGLGSNTVKADQLCVPDSIYWVTPNEVRKGEDYWARFPLEGQAFNKHFPVTKTNQIELVITAILRWEKRSPHHVQMFHVANTNHVIRLEISQVFSSYGTSRSNFNVPFYGHYPIVFIGTNKGNSMWGINFWRPNIDYFVVLWKLGIQYVTSSVSQFCGFFKQYKSS